MNSNFKEIGDREGDKKTNITSDETNPTNQKQPADFNSSILNQPNHIIPPLSPISSSENETFDDIPTHMLENDGSDGNFDENFDAEIDLNSIVCPTMGCPAELCYTGSSVTGSENGNAVCTNIENQKSQLNSISPISSTSYSRASHSSSGLGTEINCMRSDSALNLNNQPMQMVQIQNEDGTISNCYLPVMSEDAFRSQNSVSVKNEVHQETATIPTVDQAQFLIDQNDADSLDVNGPIGPKNPGKKCSNSIDNDFPIIPPSPKKRMMTIDGDESISVSPSIKSWVKETFVCQNNDLDDNEEKNESKFNDSGLDIGTACSTKREMNYSPKKKGKNRVINKVKEYDDLKINMLSYSPISRKRKKSSNSNYIKQESNSKNNQIKEIKQIDHNPQKPTQKTRAKTPHQQYACDIPNCNSIFTRFEDLTRHRKMHSSDRPFHCTHPNCNFRCKRKDNLKSHQRTHEAKRYFCEFEMCKRKERGFTRKDELKRHYFSHIRKYRKKIELCRDEEVGKYRVLLDRLYVLSENSIKVKSEAETDAGTGKSAVGKNLSQIPSKFNNNDHELLKLEQSYCNIKQECISPTMINYPATTAFNPITTATTISNPSLTLNPLPLVPVCFNLNGFNWNHLPDNLQQTFQQIIKNNGNMELSQLTASPMFNNITNTNFGPKIQPINPLLLLQNGNGPNNYTHTEEAHNLTSTEENNL